MRLAFARTYARALTLACLMSEGASVHCFTLSNKVLVLLWLLDIKLEVGLSCRLQVVL